MFSLGTHSSIHIDIFFRTVMYVDNNPLEWDKLRNIIKLCFNLAGITLTVIPDTICCLPLFVSPFRSSSLPLCVFQSLSRTHMHNHSLFFHPFHISLSLLYSFIHSPVHSSVWQSHVDWVMVCAGFVSAVRKWNNYYKIKEKREIPQWAFSWYFACKVIWLVLNYAHLGPVGLLLLLCVINISL